MRSANGPSFLTFLTSSGRPFNMSRISLTSSGLGQHPKSLLTILLVSSQARNAQRLSREISLRKAITSAFNNSKLIISHPSFLLMRHYPPLPSQLPLSFLSPFSLRFHSPIVKRFFGRAAFFSDFPSIYLYRPEGNSRPILALPAHFHALVCTGCLPTKI